MKALLHYFGLRKPSHRDHETAHLLNFVGGGIHKRIDENRELLELLELIRDEAHYF